MGLLDAVKVEHTLRIEELVVNIRMGIIHTIKTV
jgi:hypothetical protein